MHNSQQKAMLAIDGVGFDWSDMAEEQVQTNMALMAFSDSKVYNDKTCSKTCLKNYETLKKQCDDLIVKLNQTEFTATTYKRGLATLEEQLITSRKNEFEKVKQEKEGIEFKIEKFDKASKDLDKLLKSQITDKSKKGLGYSAVPPPHPLIYNRPKKLDLSYSGLYEFKEPEFKGSGSKNKQVSKVISSFVDSSLIVDKETIFPVDKKVESVKPKNHEKPVKKSVSVNYNYTAKRTHPNAQRNMIPRAVLRKTGLKPFNTARTVNTAHHKSTVFSAKPMLRFSKTAQSTGKPQKDDIRFVDSGCSRHMTQNIVYLSDFKEFDGGYVTFGGGAHGGRITGKGTLKTDSLDFEDILLKIPRKDKMYNFDMKNIVPKESLTCLVAKDTLDESMLWHRRLGHINFKNINKLVKDNLNNMYSFDMKNIVPKESLTCLVAKATSNESMLWHRRLGHINFKNINKLVKDNLDTSDESRLWHRRLGHINFRNINKLVKDNLVRGLPTKRFENDQTCVACLKGKQHRASCKSKVLNPITKPLFMLHMDLFGLTFVSSLMHKKYCLVVIDDYNRFTWVFFLTTKDETNEILKNFIKEIENLVDKKVKIIRSDNGIEFKNKVLDDFCREKVAACTIINEYAGTQGELNAGTSEEISQDCTIEDGPDNENDEKDRHEDDSSPKEVNTAGQHVNTTSPEVNIGRFKLNTVGPLVNTASSYDQDSLKDMFTMGASHTLEATHVEFFIDEDEPEVDLGNITNSYTVPTTPNTRIHKDHPIENVIGDVKSFVQTRRMTKPTSEQGLNLQALLKLYLILWVKQAEELLQFKLQQVWILVDLPIGKRAIRTKWVLKNKKDERGIAIRNKERLVTQGHRQEEGINFEEVFASVARIEAIRMFLAYASFMGFLVYQMDVKSAFLYGTIEEEVYVTQPSGFKDPDHPDKVYKVVKTLYGLHQAPIAWYETLANYLLGNRFKRGKIDQTLFIKKQKGDIFLVQVYVDDIIFGSTNKDLCTTFEKLMKDKFQMSLWYSRDSPFELVSYTHSDYAGVTQDRKSITGGFHSAKSMSHFSKQAQSTAQRPFYKQTTLTRRSVHTAKRHYYTKRPRAGNTARSYTGPVNAVRAKGVNAVKTSACWVWRPTKPNGASLAFKRHNYIDARGRSKSVGDEAVHKELGDIMERAVTTASSLEVEQDSDYVNYIVGKVVPPEWTPIKKKRFFSQIKNYFWDEPYAFRLCPDNVMRRCIAGSEILEILAHCHSGPTGGHHSASVTGRKVYEAGFYWPSIFRDAKDYVMKCDTCHKLGNISLRNEMPQNIIQVCEVFDIWGLDFMGPFPDSRGHVLNLSEHAEALVNTRFAQDLIWENYHEQNIRCAGEVLDLRSLLPGISLETAMISTMDLDGETCTDKAKITGKRSKPDKHEHGNGRARKESGERYQKSRMVNLSKTTKRQNSKYFQTSSS
ncbi:putative ribonuclease H-like domain-containing protein [Tanacetum coccineum]